MDNTEKYLTFEIDKRWFAFSVQNVLEVLINRPINPIPKSADYICGIINFRGEAVTVVDTSKKFGVKDSKNINNIVIVIQIQSENKVIKLGCICNSVRRVETLKYIDIQKVPSFGSYYNPSLLKGVFYIDDELYSIIDIDKIFSTEEFLILSDPK